MTLNNLPDISIEDIIPHRSRMKLVDEIVQLSDDAAVVLSRVSENWPLFAHGAVNTLIAIELVAQAAAIMIGWKEIQEQGFNEDGKGWLVGIKNASFHTERIPINAELTVSAAKTLAFENYTEIRGSVKLSEVGIAEVVLQVLRAKSEAPS